MKLLVDKINGTLIFASLILPLIGVLFFALADKFVDKTRKKIYIILVILVASLIFQNYIEYYLIEYKENITARTFISVYGYSVRPAIIALFIKLVSPKRKHIFVQILVIVNFLIYTTAFYSHLSISFPNNHFFGGPLRYSCLIISFILIIYNTVDIIIEYKKERMKSVLIPIILTLLVVAGIFLDMFGYDDITYRVDFITIFIVAVTVFYFIWLHLQFVYRHEDDLLAESKIQVALSQIKPHFIYNTLNAIQDIDGMPENAQNAIIDFSKYLRENLDFLTSENVIAFSKEVEHVKKYMNLEKLRFGEKINIYYDIKADDFLIPTLTLQIMVENAIKHGITKKYEGGSIKVTSFEKDEKYFVIVEDDGVGFDVNKVIGENHLGFRNAKQRLKHFVGGNIVVESEIGKGTKVTLIIPKFKGE